MEEDLGKGAAHTYTAGPALTGQKCPFVHAGGQLEVPVKCIQEVQAAQVWTVLWAHQPW